MDGAKRRWMVWGALLAVLAAGIAYALRPQPVLVDLARAEVRPLLVTIDDDGEVRVRRVFTVFAPLSGRLQRIEAEPGDPVFAGKTEVARIEPAPPAFLDARSEAESKAAAEAARAARDFAAADLARAEANLSFAVSEFERAKNLFARSAISQRALDDAERAQRVARAGVETAKAQLNVREHELTQARSRLLPRSNFDALGGVCECVPVISPVDGLVLRVLRRSEGVVAAGTALLDIGNPRDLEIVVDLLSEDAVKIVPGQRAIVAGWGGPDLDATVRRIEPFGQTKVSALGIEEQRVDVVLDPAGSPEQWERLGHGYRVDVRLVVFSGEVLTVPLGALFRSNGEWAAFVVEDGVARLRRVELGHGNGLQSEVRRGLAAGETVLLYPGDKIADGVAVAPRN